MPSVIKFTLTLFISLLVVFTLHISFLHFREQSVFQDKIVAAYIVNFLMATAIYIGLFIFQKK